MNPASPVWIGESAPIQWVKTQLKEVAETELPVLVLGEPGTGRRLAARTVHALSGRRGHPFVQVDCAALHETQVDGELFGDAAAGRQGKWELASGGTLFLEEIDALPAPSQTRLLHLLKEQSARPENGDPAPADARLIAATHQGLDRLARAGIFCAELYYRLAIVPVKLPPLRERRKDIPLLAVHFAGQCAARMGQVPPSLHQETIKALLAYSWPGNVWELKCTLERAVFLAGDGELCPEHLERPFQTRLQGTLDEPAEADALLGIKARTPREYL